MLPELSRSFEHPKVNLVIEDASKYLENKEDLFDVIICDSTDPDWGEGELWSVISRNFLTSPMNIMLVGSFATSILWET